MSIKTPPPEKLAYTIREFRQASGIGRTRIYDEIAAGRLRTVKFGRSRLIPADAANEFIAKLGTSQKEAA
mgnify:CR=1 FL=1